MKPLAPVTRVVMCRGGSGARCRGGQRRGRRSTGELPLQQLPAVTKPPVRAEHGRRLVADVDHAVLAARIAAEAVLLPWSVLEELLERRVMRVGNQVARALPATRVIGRIAPR